ncbi:helix-hairpin-helix domain-containing protein [Microtetraspora malaysiensis]|uniref:helix-hairpin-helix domain-containing protein n=1 Tax=Microtetraspora malaysiensis TaxID=161358 RepID=UPI003D9049B9
MASMLSKGRAFAGGSRVIRETAPLLDPGRPGLRVLVVLGVLAAAVAGIYAWRSQPVADPLVPPAPAGAAAIGVDSAEGVPTAAPSGAVPGAVGLASPPPTPGVTVHVTGKVRKAGVLTLPPGSRVVDAIQAAGGARPGASPDGLNLARRLVDGEQIVVGAPAVGQGAAVAVGGDGTTMISLSSATYEQLQDLPGVGEVLAQRIVEYREAHGGFQSVDQLQDVSGIGPQKFADLKGRVTP